MIKVILSLSLFFMLFFCIGQASETFVKVTGKVLNSRDSSAVSAASLFYEKLPYYDDMGMSKSTSSGGYEFILIKDTKYSFRLSGGGYLETSQELLVSDSDGDAEMVLNLFINPVEEEELPELMSLENLIFARGSDLISNTSFKELDDLAVYLEENSSIIIQLEGHTDFAGNSEANLNLSQARVEAVKDYITDKGIKKNRVLTKAFGGSQPLFTERTPEAKAKNRRVEVRVISK